ncbi:MAG: hypothetical protein LBP80_09325 [Treponema sp.]|jgi:hypothetical protein|nr:hypothetical protein [Treponema sp.]
MRPPRNRRGYFNPLKTPRRLTLFDHFITDDNLDIGTTLKLGDAYILIVAIRDFPMETYPNHIPALSALNGSCKSWERPWPNRQAPRVLGNFE